MNTHQEKILKEIRDRIVEHYEPEKIILFGSRVGKDVHKDSDFDILVIKETHKRPIERIRDVYALFSRRNFAMDVIVKTPEELKNRIESGDFFLKGILRDGRVLYEKS